VAALRRAARERGGPLRSIDVADALLDERRELDGLPRLTRCLGSYYMGLPSRKETNNDHHQNPLAPDVWRVLP
jgi:hypothetical protein